MYSLMRVEKRNGNLEDVSFDKILKRIQLLCICNPIPPEYFDIRAQFFNVS